jgi:large subunit ribosomal protein L13
MHQLRWHLELTLLLASVTVEQETKAKTVRTYTPKPGDINRQWHVIDATDVVLGRLASQTATLLRGKHKPTFAPHMDMGDFVIIINAEKVALTGAKLEQKRAYRHSGFPGGLKSVNYAELLEKNPVRAVEKAIKGMLPKNSLAAQQIGKLKVYRGAEHPHSAQQPQTFEITQVAQ